MKAAVPGFLAHPENTPILSHQSLFMDHLQKNWSAQPWNSFLSISSRRQKRICLPG
jgi:hypothetical protein